MLFRYLTPWNENFDCVRARLSKVVNEITRRQTLFFKLKNWNISKIFLQILTKIL